MKASSRVAYVITAGHCVPGIIDVNQNQLPNYKKMIIRKIDANYSKPVFIQITGVLFASFQNVDLSVITIKESTDDLIKLGITPLEVQLAEPQVQNSVVIYNSLTGEQSECIIEKHVDYLDYKTWTSRWSTRLSSECKLAPGWSGAPVIDEKTKAVVGIVSGGNDSGTCDDYCERTQMGERLALKNRSYISNLSFLKSCVLENGTLDLKCLTIMTERSSSPREVSDRWDAL